MHMLKIKGLEGFKQPANPAFTSAAPKAGEFLGRQRERKPGQKVRERTSARAQKKDRERGADRERERGSISRTPDIDVPIDVQGATALVVPPSPRLARVMRIQFINHHLSDDMPLTGH